MSHNESNHRTSERPQVLSGSDVFMDELEFFSATASNRFLVQVMTFEGDDAGKKLIDMMVASPVREKLLVVDYYSDVVINDTLLHLPPGLITKSAWKEYNETQKLLQFAQDRGIHVARTNPVGLLYTKYPFRNHKKCVIIDDHVFVGGINFSDHNFVWHDMMIRLDSEALAETATHDVQMNANGIKTSGIHNSGDSTLVYLNRNSEAEYTQVFNWIRSAKRSITIFSPYFSEPFLTVIKSVSNQVDIKMIVPGQNNKGVFSDYLKRESESGWFRLFEYPQAMSHLKAILIDENQLVFGSSNFDFISYLFEEEILIRTTSSKIVDEFKDLVLKQQVKASTHVLNPSYNKLKSYIPSLMWTLLKVTDPKSIL